MKKKNNDGFYVAIGMFFVLSICILLGFCGEEIISEVDMFDKVMIFILKVIGLIFLGAIFVYAVIVCISDFSFDIKNYLSLKNDEWKLISVIGKNKSYSHIIFDKNIDTFDSSYGYEKLKNVIFYSENLKIKREAFSNCKKLQQITFYENPSYIEKDAFLGCESLSLIRFYGTKEEWESHKIFIPSNPKIEFLGNSENKITMNKTKIDLNYNGTINIRNR